MIPPLRILNFNCFPSRATIRFLTTASRIIDVQLNENNGVTTVALQKPPVNTLNTEMLTELGNVLRSLEGARCRGMILTSGMPNVFSAGLDLMEFYKPDVKRLENFWRTLQDTWLQLYTTSFPTVALINGHSPAGGCLLAMSCEYRIMVGKQYTIGLNEAKIGIPAPFWFMDVMRNTIGHRKSELALFMGKMHSADEALSVGLIDDLGENLSQALDKAGEYFKQNSKVDAFTRSLMKKSFRQDVVDKFERGRKHDLEFTVASAAFPEVQKKLEVYIENLKKKQP